MRRQARVVDTGAGGPGRALVELDTVGQCQRCSRGEGCGAALFDPQQAKIRLWVESDEKSSAFVGQQVMLEIDEQGSGWLWPVFGAYGLPLSGLLVATAASTASTADASDFAELFVVLSALAGLFGGIFAWRQVAPGVLARAERSLCLRSARIVATYSSSATYPSSAHRSAE
ncbi:MAG: SoxR reducing system RseC family protein [Granulosicoccus sp.]